MWESERTNSCQPSPGVWRVWGLRGQPLQAFPLGCTTRPKCTLKPQVTLSQMLTPPPTPARGSISPEEEYLPPGGSTLVRLPGSLRGHGD